MLKPITKDTKRPDYVLQKNSPFSVYVDVKCLQFYRPNNKLSFYLNVKAVEELNIFKPFLFFAIYDKNEVVTYKEKKDISSLEKFPEPKFISLQKIKQNTPTEEKYIIEIKDLNTFDEVMKETIVESFYDKKWI